MSFNLQNLDSAISLNDKPLAASLCDELVKEIYHQPEQFELPMLEKLMKDLRAKRMFSSMVKIGDACMQNGKTSLKIRKQFAQALIEEKVFTAAIHVLDDIIRDSENVTDEGSLFERREALGLTGRVYKQLYVIADNPTHPSAKEFIKKSITAYMQVYDSNPSSYIWHGINAVAIASRAKVDGIEVLKRIRSNGVTKLLPVVVLTSSKEQSDVTACYEYNCNSYVRKPVDFNQFAEAVKQLGLYWLVLNEPPTK